MESNGIISIPCNVPVNSGGMNLVSVREIASKIGIVTNFAGKSKRELCTLLNSIDDPVKAMQVASLCDDLGISYEFSVEYVDKDDIKIIDGVERVAVKWHGFEEKTFEPLSNVQHLIKEDNESNVQHAIQEENKEEGRTRGNKLLKQHRKCLAKYVLGDFIAVGATSSVYYVGNDHKQVVKIVKLTEKYDKNDFDTEAAFQMLTSNLGFTARYIDHFVCNNYGYLIMDYWQTLDKVDVDKKLVAKKLTKMLADLKDAGIVHGDFRKPNIGVLVKKDDIDVVLLDWGKAFIPKDFNAKDLEERVSVAKASLGISNKKTSTPFDIDRLMLEQIIDIDYS